MDCSPTHNILIINPNSNKDITDRTQQIANKILPKDSIAQVIHPKESPLSIETYADRLVAEPLTIELLSLNQGYDAYVMACFDDIAIQAARRFLNVLVIDCIEAAIKLAYMASRK